MTSELKPCPFCGGTRATITSECDIDTEGKFYRVECLDCRTKTKERYALETCPIFYESVRNDWNTRATPSVDTHLCNTKDVENHASQNLAHKPDTLAELKRYGISMFGNGAVEMGEGEFVLYSEAAAAFAAKDAEITKISIYNDAYWKQVLEHRARVESAEAELAQIKAQKPICYVDESGIVAIGMGGVSTVHTQFESHKSDRFCHALYAAPVSDSLKAENEQYKQVLTQIASFDGDIEGEAHAYCIELSHTALDVEASNDKG